MAAASPPDVLRLRESMQRLVRRFGALAGDTTPCGQPISTSHAHALLFLLAHSGSAPTQQQLGAALGIDKSNVARLCARMEDDGHLSQKVCAEDARSRRLSLTPKGERLAQRVEAASLSKFAAVLEHVPPEKRAGLLSALSLFNDAVEAAGSPSAEE